MASRLLVSKPLHSERHLAFLLGVPIADLRDLARKSHSLYAPFVKTQVRHGKVKERSIDNPLEELKAAQKKIKTRIIDPLVLPTALTGGVSGRSIQDNARPHVARNVIVAMDFANYFPRITNRQVAMMWRARFGASLDVSWLLTRLTTFQGHLPQGSPASNGIANLVVLGFLEEAVALCEANGCSLTVYVDDITISGGNDAPALLSKVAVLASKFGFCIARRKSKVMRAHQRQEVTGIVVNRKLSSGRVRVRGLRRQLINALSGSEEVEPLATLRGLVAQIGSTCPGQARGLKRLLNNVETQRLVSECSSL